MAEVMKRASKGPKRRNERNILTFYEKIAVIRYYDETNISRNSLAKMFHCCATQIRRILEKKDELLQQLATLSEADASIIIEEMTRKRRKFEMSAISFILHQWVERCRQLRLRKAITNETLKDTALKMAAILNLPTFRPSYRWLNRFRGKYKYNEQDLCTDGVFTMEGELSVEDIIIEFKDSLPSFMQKEILAITTTNKPEAKAKSNKSNGSVAAKRTEVPVLINDNSEDYELSEDDVDAEDDDVVEVTPAQSSNSVASPSATRNEQNVPDRAEADEMPLDMRKSAGTTALLSNIFPHLAVIHQFALLNADVKALELISQLGVHMQMQAAEGAYKPMSQSASDFNIPSTAINEAVGGIYADIDDIVLIE